MTVVAERTVCRVAVNLEASCSAACEALARSEYDGTYYTRPAYPLSVVALPASGAEYEYQCSRVARYNARLASKRGYTHSLINRADWTDDLHALRSSAEFRQGRNMPDAYMQRQEYGVDPAADEQCPRHLSVFHGVTSPDGRLVAYMHMVQCGQIVRVNTILGHWDHMDDQVVWLLVMEALKWHIDERGVEYGLYFTHDSGHGPGLRYFKERFRFAPSVVEWVF